MYPLYQIGQSAENKVDRISLAVYRISLQKALFSSPFISNQCKNRNGHELPGFESAG